MSNVGFIGLGIMGTPMAGHLLGGGPRLFAYSRSAVPQALAAYGAAVCASAQEVAQRADVIITMVPDTPEVEAVLFGPAAWPRVLAGGNIVVDMSSIAPMATKDFARRINEHGCDYLDAPVSGGEVGAKAASLTIMVGGPERAFETVKPLFDLMGKNITLVGGNGDGQTTKVANQIIVALTIEAVGEALLFASKAGADPARVRKALMGGFAASRILEVHGERMVTRNFDPGFRIELHQKDLNLALSGARALGVSLPNTATCQELFNAATAAGGKAWDHSGMVRVLEKLACHEIGEAQRDDGGRSLKPSVLESPAMSAPERELLLRMFRAAVDAAAPDLCVPSHLPTPPAGRTVVIGAGKAAAAMARAVETHWPAGKPLSGLVVTRYGHGVGPLPRIAVVEASHPVPDSAGQAAAARMLALVGDLGPDDLVLCLISGGGSALLALPARGISLADKQTVNRALLRSGAGIHEMNCVRKHLSAIKGGRLAAAAAPAALVTLTISDVPGDDPSVIASGPTVPDPTTLADARAVLVRYGIVPPPAVAARLANANAETPKPGDPAFAHTRLVMIATPQDALEAAAAVARAAGVTPVILGNAIEGEASEVARVMAGIARQCAEHGQPAPAPCVLISGGETTVTVRGGGRGGRNAEFLLGLAVALDGDAGIHAIAGDTDGIDGTEDNAGALLSPDTLSRAAARGLNARDRLADNDGYGFFDVLSDLVTTGPTLTNVNDFRAILVGG